MNRLQAGLIVGDPDAIEQLKGEVGASRALEIISSLPKELPSAIAPIQQHLGQLLNTDLLAMTDGVITWAPNTQNVQPEQAAGIANNTVSLYSACERSSNVGRWILGNIANLLDDAGIPMEELIHGTNLAYNTLVCSRTTFKFFKHKRYPMPFSHHKEIAYAKDLSDGQKHDIAQYSADQNLTLTETRAIIRTTQTLVRDAGTTELPDIASIHESIETPTQAGRKYLILTGDTSNIMDNRPDEAAMAVADAVYEIRSVIKEPQRD